MDTLHSPFGELTLERLPFVQRDTLRAWDAADEYILEHLHQASILTDTPKRVLVINDQFGALSLSLRHHDVTAWSDSYISHSAIDHNGALNHLTHRITCLPSVASLTGEFDVVIIKVPKTLALLHTQLQQLQAHLHEHSVVIGAGMVKHLQKSNFAAFEEHIGETTASLAKKKARLIFAQYQGKQTPAINNTEFTLPNGPTLSHYPNVFSKEKLDIGARAMLDSFHQLPKVKSIIDLGCGNGVLGLMAKKHDSAANVCFVDESYMALASAEVNMNNAMGSEGCTFIASDCLDNVATTPDLILCNPPFHQQHTIGDHIAWKMFQQSARLLNDGGQLWVVGNRHLGYHVKLQRLFDRVEQISSTNKFVVLACTK